MALIMSTGLSLQDTLIYLNLIIALVIEIVLVILILKDFIKKHSDGSDINKVFKELKDIISKSNKQLITDLCGWVQKIDDKFINKLINIEAAINNCLIIKKATDDLQNTLNKINNKFNKEIEPEVESLNKKINSLEKIIIGGLLLNYYTIGKKIAFIIVDLIRSRTNPEIDKIVKELVSKVNEQARILAETSKDLWSLASKIKIYTILKILSAEEPPLELVDKEALSKLENELKRDLEETCRTEIQELDVTRLGKLLASGCN